MKQEGFTFRPEYTHLSELQWLVPPGTSFGGLTATATKVEIEEIKKLLKMPPKHTRVIHLANDRPNIAFQVRQMKFAASSYKDLAFVIPKDVKADSPPLPFMVFTKSRSKRTRIGMGA
ncbi:hypothetical protein M422DRAFT_274895 [Sphaerobolus stellatus SS14]|uniref:Uncharacterized protein n=1 Tax=Sphaerobolus stellatus (strain SS14) TaxID=990650 RepID=A0A0C9T5Y8_SPHS4|nr:hypothetical protein M422DRAFT_274895 [Sphaerobolus stellatus SS14]